MFQILLDHHKILKKKAEWVNTGLSFLIRRTSTVYPHQVWCWSWGDPRMLIVVGENDIHPFLVAQIKYMAGCVCKSRHTVNV